VTTVLVVQSDPLLNDGWCFALEEAGHVVLAAEDTREGLVRVREGGIDVVVLDGPAEGSALRDFVRELERLPDAPPFILVSSSPAAPEISARLGAAAFVPKPCSPAELGEVLRRFVR
jgi:CheY-like chemotaxis protein